MPLEAGDERIPIHRHVERSDNGRRAIPVVVQPATAFEGVDQRAIDHHIRPPRLSQQLVRGALDGPPIAGRDVHQGAVHVEDDTVELGGRLQQPGDGVRGPPHLRLGADGDAHATVEIGVLAVAVPHQDALGGQPIDHPAVVLAEVHHQKVAVFGARGQPQSAHVCGEAGARRGDLGHVFTGGLGTLHARKGGRDGGAIDVEGVEHAAQAFDVVGLGHDHADAQTGQTVDLAEAAGDKEVRVRGDEILGALAEEFAVGLVDDHGTIERGQGLLDHRPRHHGAGGIGGVGQSHQADLRPMAVWLKGCQPGLVVEGKGRGRVAAQIDLHHLVAQQAGPEAEHVVARRDGEQGLARQQVAVEDGLDPLVAPRCAGDLVLFQAEVAGGLFMPLAVDGIGGDVLTAQGFDHGLDHEFRRPGRVLVDIQAQQVGALKGRDAVGRDVVELQTTGQEDGHPPGLRCRVWVVRGHVLVVHLVGGPRNGAETGSATCVPDITCCLACWKGLARLAGCSLACHSRRAAAHADGLEDHLAQGHLEDVRGAQSLELRDQPRHICPRHGDLDRVVLGAVETGHRG